MGNPEHVEVFKRGPEAVQQYVAAKGISGLDLSETKFENIKHVRAYNLHRANLENSAFENCAISILPSHANLRNCVFRGSATKIINVTMSNMSGAEFYDIDLSLANGLSQKQLNSTKIGVGVRLNEYLNAPSHWDTPDVSYVRGTSTASSPIAGKEQVVNSTISKQNFEETKQRVKLNREPIHLVSQSILLLLPEERERVRGSNELSPEAKEEILETLNRLEGLVEEVRPLALKDTADLSDETAASLENWTSRFNKELRHNFQKFIDPKNIASAAIPLAFIGSCGALGALVGGSVGFGAGSLFGKMITGQIKPSKAVDLIEKELFDAEADSSSQSQ